jgi:hypothetical protein
VLVILVSRCVMQRHVHRARPTLISPKRFFLSIAVATLSKACIVSVRRNTELADSDSPHRMNGWMDGRVLI